MTAVVSSSYFPSDFFAFFAAPDAEQRQRRFRRHRRHRDRRDERCFRQNVAAIDIRLDSFTFDVLFLRFVRRF